MVLSRSFLFHLFLVLGHSYLFSRALLPLASSRKITHLIYFVALPLTFTMYEPRGKSLLVAVSILTSLGFMLIGFDNGLMGGLGTFHCGSSCSHPTASS